MYKMQHLVLLFAVTAIFGWQIAVAVSLTIEATQFEAYWRRLKKSVGPWKPFLTYWWADTVFDLVADTIGIGLWIITQSFL